MYLATEAVAAGATKKEVESESDMMEATEASVKDDSNKEIVQESSEETPGNIHEFWEMNNNVKIKTRPFLIQ